MPDHPPRMAEPPIPTALSPEPNDYIAFINSAPVIRGRADDFVKAFAENSIIVYANDFPPPTADDGTTP